MALSPTYVVVILLLGLLAYSPQDFRSDIADLVYHDVGPKLLLVQAYSPWSWQTLRNCQDKEQNWRQN